MKLELANVRLPLAEFALELDATLGARVTGVFGASGAGKTSLLEIIAGLRRPAAGRVALDGETLSDTAKKIFLPPERRGIGYVPQDIALFPHLDVRANLLYGRHADGADAPGAGKTSFTQVVETLGLAGFEARRVGTLSGGEQRRVAFGRAVLAAPRLLLLDEPFAGLDTALKERLLPHLRALRDEFSIPVFVVSHHADEIVALCDDVLVLDQGRCVRRGPPTEIFTVSNRPGYVLKRTD